MNVMAIFLLAVCVYDLVRPFILIEQRRKELRKSWLDIAKLKEFKPYAFSVLVNIVAIVFFVHYLFWS